MRTPNKILVIRHVVPTELNGRSLGVISPVIAFHQISSKYALSANKRGVIEAQRVTRMTKPNTLRQRETSPSLPSKSKITGIRDKTEKDQDRAIVIVNTSRRDACYHSNPTIALCISLSLI